MPGAIVGRWQSVSGRLRVDAAMEQASAAERTVALMVLADAAKERTDAAQRQVGAAPVRAVAAG